MGATVHGSGGGLVSKRLIVEGAQALDQCSRSKFPTRRMGGRPIYLGAEVDMVVVGIFTMVPSE